ncbi:MAG: four helix bundle protein [Candidatus Omnitrophica bacterium]|nr:four helix bundle protein [Candidatus Omnitrophota bacterium]
MEKKKTLKTYKDLIAWQKSYNLCLTIYKTTQTFPRTEQYGLTSQMNRSALSVPSNIAEGYTRFGTAEYLRFLSISYASLAELETQLFLARDLNYLKQASFNKIIELHDEVQRIMHKLMSVLKNKL